MLKTLRAFREDRAVASFAATSRFGIWAITQSIDFKQDLIIIEYGPGAGPITAYLLKKINQNSKIIAIESNQKLAEDLRKIDDQRLIVINDQVENLTNILTDLNIVQVDYIISGIPFSFLSENVAWKIVTESFQILKSDGKFLIYQFKPKVLNYLQDNFKEIKTKRIWLNLPPLYVFSATK